MYEFTSDVWLFKYVLLERKHVCVGLDAHENAYILFNSIFKCKILSRSFANLIENSISRYFTRAVSTRGLLSRFSSRYIHYHPSVALQRYRFEIKKEIKLSQTNDGWMNPASYSHLWFQQNPNHDWCRASTAYYFWLYTQWSLCLSHLNGWVMDCVSLPTMYVSQKGAWRLDTHLF